jgi:hypothetical protein
VEAAAGMEVGKRMAHMSTVKVTMEINAEIPSGAPDQVVRTVTENCRTLKFSSQGFEAE